MRCGRRLLLSWFRREHTLPTPLQSRLGKFVGLAPIKLVEMKFLADFMQADAV
jgi:hypothetical protein